MARIYKDFSEFRSENKSIFKFLSKSDNRGLHEAIWNARDIEITALKKKINELQQDLSDERQNFTHQDQELNQCKKSIFDSTDKIDEVRQELYRSQDQNSLLRANFNSLNSDYQILKNRVHDIEASEQNALFRFEKSLELISQLEMHIKRQKGMIEELRESNTRLFDECEEAKRSVSPLHYQVKELTAGMQMLELDLDQYKTFNEQSKRHIEQQDVHMEKLKANSKVLKELAEKSKSDFHGACEDLKRHLMIQEDLQKKLDAFEHERLNFIAKENAQATFIEELKEGVRNLKHNLLEETNKLSVIEKENSEIKKNIETLNASEHYHRTELLKARSELEKSRQEKEKLSNELRILNNTLRDVQTSLGQIHQQYVRSPKHPSLYS